MRTVEDIEQALAEFPRISWPSSVRGSKLLTLPASTKASRGTQKRADLTDSPNRPSPISAPAALGSCEALRQSDILGGVWKASGVGGASRRRPVMVLDRLAFGLRRHSLIYAAASAPLAPSQCELRPSRHNSGRIDAAVALVIMVLDVEEVDCLGDARQVVKLSQIAAQRRVVPYLAKIALEVPEIDRVEADQGGEQAPVRFRQSLAHEEALASESRLEPVERLAQL